MDPTSPAGQKFLQMVEEHHDRLDAQQQVMLDGFALAFLDATGLPADDCEMMVEEKAHSDEEKGEHVRVQRIWFQRKGAS